MKGLPAFLCSLLLAVLTALNLPTRALAASNLAFALRVGGSGGPGLSAITIWDSVTAIAVAPDGSIWLAGSAGSNDFPLVNALFTSKQFYSYASFIAHISRDGLALLYSSFFPGSVRAIAVDTQGYVYLAGGNTGDLVPTPGVLQPNYARDPSIAYATSDGYLAKLSADGSKIIYATYLGGLRDDWITALKVDASGNAYFAGQTASGDFPITLKDSGTAPSCSNCYQAFIGAVNADASRLLYARYLPGAVINALALDAQKNVYLTGAANAVGFPATDGALQPWTGGSQDAFVTRIDANGAIIYSTLLGGYNDDSAASIGVDSSGNAWIGGATRSGNFPTTANAFQRQLTGFGACLVTNRGDGFLAKVDPSGSRLLASTYVGGSGCDEVRTIAVASDGTVFIAGRTTSEDVPLVDAIQNSMLPGTYAIVQDRFNSFKDPLSDSFVMKFSADASQLLFSTYLGSAAADAAAGLAVDAAGSAYLAGTMSQPSDFPVYNSPLNTGTIFVAKLNGGGMPPHFTRNDVVNADAGTAGLIPGSNAILRGTNLGGAMVTFGGVPATITSRTSANGQDEVRFIVPDAPRDASLVVVNTQESVGTASGIPFGFLLHWTGNGQTATAETAVPEPITLSATNAGGTPIDSSAVMVDWRVTAGGAAVPRGVGEWWSGEVRWVWTLGSPGPQQAEAVVTTGYGGTSGAARIIFTATATEASGTPAVLPVNGIVNAAGYVKSALALAPGMYTALFGSNLSASPTAAPGSGQTLLSGTRVIVDGISAPLYWVSQGQVNFQVPLQVAGKTSVAVVVSVNGKLSSAVTMPVLAAVPGLFSAQASGAGPAAAVNQDASLNSASQPAPRGSVVAFYGTGLGPTTAVDSCTNCGAVALSFTLEKPVVTLGGVRATVEYSGLTPGYPGLWQVNVRIPDSAPTGEVPVQLTTGGQSANPVTLFVE